MTTEIFILNHNASESRVFTVSPENPFNTSDFKLEATAYFGPPRDTRDGQGGWTGDAYRFELYSREANRKGDRQCIIKESNGCGDYFYVFPRWRSETLLASILALPETVRWDVCSNITIALKSVAAAQMEAGAAQVKRAFVEGRLSKRKVRGQDAYKVSILEPWQVAAA
jgi:hypothetical protein